MTGKARHTQRRGSATFNDANLSVPSHLTDVLIEEILTLPASGPDGPHARGLAYLQECLLSKFVSKDTDPAEIRRERAISKWLDQEVRNAATNERIWTMCEDYHILPRVPWRKFRSYCASLVASIIGDLPPESAFIGGFSGGASTSKKRTKSHPSSKYTGKAHCTSAALPWWEEVVIPQLPGWYRNVIILDEDCLPFTGPNVLTVVKHDCNVMFTVPKNTTIDRVACKEPDINMFMQKGLGKFIRKRLRRRVGINLNDQSINNGLAREGSIDGTLATVDLSSASDSVTTALVEAFLPPLWYSAMNAIRCSHTLIDGEMHVNEMFSSMGNGFTFELESLLFYVIARAVMYFEGVSGKVSVYGDDIIIPSGVYHQLEWVLHILGFRVNPDKSFYEGHFRESCGGHYLHGYDVTPFYLRAPIVSLTDLIHMCNQIRLWSWRQSTFQRYGLLDPTFEELWHVLAAFVPKSLWGGWNYNDPHQLVSPGRPKMRLVPIDERHPTGVGGFIHWLQSNDGKQDTEYSMETSHRITNIEKCRLRPAKQNRYCTSLFWGEV